ncbi:MAG: HAD family hydrolase [Terriglobales bacterium]
MAAITTLLFDLGGVVLSNAWDHSQRAAVAAHFGLDPAALEARNAQWMAPLETGQISLDEYLVRVVFDKPRAFTPADLSAFIRSCSQPMPETLALLGELASAGRLRLATLNNEGRDLNQHRIARFGLKRYFSVFCSSCYLGARKPEPEIYRRALGILQADPGECLFIDDREENLAGAQAVGIEGLHFTSAANLRAAFGQRGLL